MEEVNGEREHISKVLAEMEEAQAAEADAREKADQGEEQQFDTKDYVNLLKQRGI